MKRRYFSPILASLLFVLASTLLCFGHPIQEDGMTYLKTGAAAAQSGKFQEAIEPLKKALTLKLDESNKAIAYYLLGFSYEGLKQNEEAIAAYVQSVALKPDFATGQLALAKAYFGIKKYDDAAAAYKQVIKYDPKSLTAYFSLGAVYLTNKKFDEAIEPLQKAVELKSDFPEAHQYLGLAYLQSGKKDEALKEVEALRKIDGSKADKLQSEIDKFGSASTATNTAENKNITPSNSKVPGRIFIAVAPIKNKSGQAFPIAQMRAQFVRRILNAYYDTTVLDGTDEKAVTEEAKSKNCDYILYSEIRRGLDERPQTDNVAGLGTQNTEVRINVKLVRVSDGKTEFDNTIVGREGRTSREDLVGLSTVDLAAREILGELQKKKNN